MSYLNNRFDINLASAAATSHPETAATPTTIATSKNHWSWAQTFESPSKQRGKSCIMINYFVLHVILDYAALFTLYIYKP